MKWQIIHIFFCPKGYTLRLLLDSNICCHARLWRPFGGSANFCNFCSFCFGFPLLFGFFSVMVPS